ncbi:MAG: hypothetical protein GYB30_08565 [Gammaproteobacteria bacterium]|nr:hypothetical protein [Gammaproteobacteria bacterium]
MRNGLLATLTVGLQLILLTPAAQAQQNWVEAFPERYETVEQFFLQHGCKYAQNSAYIYEPSSGIWWSSKEAINAYPNVSYAFMAEPCDIAVEQQTLERLLNVKFGTAQRIVLYFDITRDEHVDMRNIIRKNKGMWEKYQRRLSLLNEFNELPKYKVITPNLSAGSQP